jgi:hypothetical protein
MTKERIVECRDGPADGCKFTVPLDCHGILVSIVPEDEVAVEVKVRAWYREGSNPKEFHYVRDI